MLIDIDFRSEFEIARSTGNYKAILQSLPFIFVGNIDRLQQIIAIVSEAARLSLKKKGMHIAPWRKAEYMKAKWLSPHVRTAVPPTQNEAVSVQETETEAEERAGEDETKKEVTETGAEAVVEAAEEESECGVLDLIFGEETTPSGEPRSFLSSPVKLSGVEAKGLTPVIVAWQPPVIKPKSCERGNRVVVTGLASLLKEKP